MFPVPARAAVTVKVPFYSCGHYTRSNRLTASTKFPRMLCPMVYIGDNTQMKYLCPRIGFHRNPRGLQLHVENISILVSIRHALLMHDELFWCVSYFVVCFPNSKSRNVYNIAISLFFRIFEQTWMILCI